MTATTCNCLWNNKTNPSKAAECLCMYSPESTGCCKKKMLEWLKKKAKGK
jgi:hypothetical protein